MEMLKHFLIIFFLNGFVESFELKCVFELNFEEEECVVKFIKVLEDDIAATGVFGVFTPLEKTNDDVKEILISKEVETERVPTKVCELFENLERFDIRGSSVIRINREVFTNCKKVWKVSVINSNLTTLPEDLFVDLFELTHLYLQDNKLIALSSELILRNTKLELLSAENNYLSFIDTDLTSVTSIDFRGNVCIDKRFPEDITNLVLFNNEVASKCESPMKKSSLLKSKEIVELKRQKEKYETENVAMTLNITQLVTKVETLECENLVLETKVSSMEPENLSAKSRISSLESKVNSLQLSFDSADGNLNAATKSILVLSKALQSCPSGENRFGDEHKIDLKCKCYDDEKSCFAIDLKVQFNNTRLNNFFNGTMEWNDKSKLNSLTISKQQTLFLPINFGETFSNLTELIVTYSGLFSIGNTCFNGLNNLRTLILKGNKIHEIPLDAFATVVMLKKLDLSENRIEKLEVGAFNHLENLLHLNVENNLLITVTTEIFKFLVNLKTLNLSGNKLKFISFNLLTSLKSIEKADFTNNGCIDISYPEANIEIFEAAINEKCFGTVELHCSKNVNEKVEEDDFAGDCIIQDLTIQYPRTRISNVYFEDNVTASDISTLMIFDQKMKFVPFQLSISFTNLTSIVIINSNLISLLKNDFQGLQGLKQLQITGNKLSSIDVEAFSGLTQLESLDLSSNEIISLPSKIFLHLRKVEKLILSFNLMKTFSADVLPIKGSIEEFRINDNHLEIIEAKTLRLLKNAQLIDFSNNTCIDKKYEKTDDYKKYLIEFSGEIDLNCSLDY